MPLTDCVETPVRDQIDTRDVRGSTGEIYESDEMGDAENTRDFFDVRRRDLLSI